MKSAIITGGTGAIGTALIRELTSNGISVLVLVRPGSARKDNIICNSLVSVLECEMKDYSSISNDGKDEYDVFYHLAWEGTAGQGRHNMYLQNENVKYALDAVGLAKRFGCRLFVGAGSQAEYGRHEGILMADTPTFPEMGYGYAKLCAGQMTREYAHQLDMSHVWVRVLSVYGPNDGSQSMIMSTIAKLRAGEVPQFTEGKQQWDYLYSGDAAEALRLIGEKGKDGKTYVLGSGVAYPLRKYIEELRDVVSPGAALGIGDIPYGSRQVMYLCADTRPLWEDLEWKAHTPFKTGIKNIVEKEKRG